MPITTTHQIWSPSDTDAWDIIVDLAAMAVSIDTALSRASNYRRGTFAEMSAATTLPVGTRWLASDRGVTYWKTPTAWRLEGVVASAAERNSVITTPVQFATVYRSDIDNSETYYDTYNASSNPAGKTPSGWYANAQRTLRGNVTFPPLNAGAASGRITVNFPAGYFQTPPHFIINDSYGGGRRTPYALSVTTTSASFNLANLSTGGESNSSTTPWIAIQ